MGIEIIRQALRLPTIGTKLHNRRSACGELSVDEMRHLFRHDFEVRQVELARDMSAQAILQSRKSGAHRADHSVYHGS